CGAAESTIPTSDPRTQRQSAAQPSSSRGVETGPRRWCPFETVCSCRTARDRERLKVLPPRRRHCVLITLALAAAALAAQSSTPAAVPDFASRDPKVRPQDDLFTHVNTAWLTATPIPSDRVSYGTFIELADRAEMDVRIVVEELSTTPKRAGSPSQQIADLYASVMDEARLNALGTTPIRPELARIDAIATARDVAEVAGYLSSIAAGGPFGGAVVEDVRAPGRLVAQVSQGGTLLPDRKDYLDQ